MNIGLKIKNTWVYQTFMAIKQKLFILQNSSWYQIKDKFVYNIMKSLNSVKLLKVSREIDFFFNFSHKMGPRWSGGDFQQGGTVGLDLKYLANMRFIGLIICNHIF